MSYLAASTLAHGSTRSILAKRYSLPTSRDIGEDAARDRIHLPQEALSAFGLSDTDILAGRRGTSSLWLVRHLAARARREYALARESLLASDRRALLPAEIMQHIYFALLEDVEQRGDDVLTNGPRPKLSPRRKMERALHASHSPLFPFGHKVRARVLNGSLSIVQVGGIFRRSN